MHPLSADGEINPDEIGSFGGVLRSNPFVVRWLALLFTHVALICYRLGCTLRAVQTEVVVEDKRARTKTY